MKSLYCATARRRHLSIHNALFCRWIVLGNQSDIMEIHRVAIEVDLASGTMS